MRFKIGMFAILTAAVLVSTLAVAAEEPSEQVKRMDAAATVLDEIMGTPDKGIPEELLDSAKCLAVIPSMVKIGLVFGGRHGRGVATCRTTSGWSAPAPFTVTGGSWGLQIGGEAIDVVMLVMNDQGMEKMLSSKFKIGADACAAAGPVGRHVEGTTDWKMRAEVLTYSRARGAFAGVTCSTWVMASRRKSIRNMPVPSCARCMSCRRSTTNNGYTRQSKPARSHAGQAFLCLQLRV